MWRHELQPIKFTLVLDNFGVKYISEENKQHLIDALQSTYHIDINDSRDKYCSLNLIWDFFKQCVHVLMPGYVKQALVWF